MRKRKYIQAKDRKNIVRNLTRKYGFRCWYCGVDLNKPDITFHLDHIVPLSDSGSDDNENFALSCHFCNLAKNKHQICDFLMYLSHVRSSSFSCPILCRYHDEIDDVAADRLSTSFF